MKKYSWIFALILALTMAFVFTACPGDPDDTTTTTENPPPGPPGPGPNPPGPGPNPPEPDGSLSIVFGDDKTEVLPGNNGSIAYTANGAGYTFSYGTVTNSNYGNAIVRFMVDLGDKDLGDYGKVSFKWQAHGYKQADVTSTKKLYLLASVSGTAIEPYQNDAAIKALIVSTDYFDTNHEGDHQNDFYASGSPAPVVNGTTIHNVELPIVKGLNLTGEVWFSVYLHADPKFSFYNTEAKYTVSDFKFVFGESEVAPTVPGEDAEDAPPDPLPEGALPFDFTVIPSNWETIGYPLNENPNAATLPDGDFDETTANALTLEFTLNLQRVNIKLAPEQIAALKNRNGPNVTIEIDGEKISGSGNFRYTIGSASAGGAWNATPTLPSGDFDDLCGSDNAKDLAFGDNAAQEGRLEYFIIQYQGNATATIQINSIRIYTTPFKVTFADGDVKAFNVEVELVGTTGFTVKDTENNYDWAYPYFKVTFPEGKKLSDYSYFECKLTLINTQYKPFYVNAYNEAPTGQMTLGNTIAKRTSDAGATGVESIEKLLITVGEVDGNEVWIALRSHVATNDQYKVTDIKFY